MSSQKQKIVTLTQYLKKNPGDSFTKFALALELLKQEDSTKARKLFESIRSQDPNYLGVYYHLGKLYEREGEPKRAEQMYEEGIAIAREQGESRTLRELQEAKSMLEWNDE